jgi:hypothetical protein
VSASEKLKALYDEHFQNDDLILNAFPQIVAVVEAAERYGSANDIHAWGETIDDPALSDLAAALAALDEALGK